MLKYSTNNLKVLLKNVFENEENDPRMKSEIKERGRRKERMNEEKKGGKEGRMKEERKEGREKIKENEIRTHLMPRS